MEYFATIKDYLRENLTEFRYLHSLRVAAVAKELARIYHFNEDKAYFTGLIHDIAKDFSEEKTRTLALKYQLPKELFNASYKDIIHSDIGACFAREKYSIDEDCYYAIKYHTIGDVSMNDFAKIIFIADKIGRKNLDSSLLEVKKLVYNGKLDCALLLCLESQKERLESISKRMHPHTLLLLNSLKKDKKD